MSLLQRIFPPDPRTVGEEPDYRFTMANERTFLAWIRTALALVAGGLGAINLLPDVSGSETLGVVLLAMGFALSSVAYRRWALNEQSMRLGTPLPVSRLPMLTAIGTAMIAIIAAVMFVVTP